MNGVTSLIGVLDVTSQILMKNHLSLGISCYCGKGYWKQTTLWMVRTGKNSSNYGQKWLSPENFTPKRNLQTANHIWKCLLHGHWTFKDSQLAKEEWIKTHSTVSSLLSRQVEQLSPWIYFLLYYSNHSLLIFEKVRRRNNYL